MSKLMETIEYQRIMDGCEKPEGLYENISAFHGARPGKNWRPYVPQTRYSEKYMPLDLDNRRFWCEITRTINNARRSIDMTYIGEYVMSDWHKAGMWLIENAPSKDVYVKVMYKMYKIIKLAEAYAKVAGCTLGDVLRDAVNKRLRVRDPELQEDIIEMLSLWQAQWRDENELYGWLR